MAKLHELEQYLNYEFSTGCYTGNDYLSFQRKYINYLRALCKDNGWELIVSSKSHYWFSVFIRNQSGNHLYLCISDVRFWKNEWYNRILIRTANHEKDYHGGGNHHTSLPNLTQTANYLFGLF